MSRYIKQDFPVTLISTRKFEMIDPTKFPMYDLSYEKLEEVWMFCIAVAGKNAMTTAKCLDVFINKVFAASKQLMLNESTGPLGAIYHIMKCHREQRHITEPGSAREFINEMLKTSGIGCQTIKGGAIRSSAYYIHNTVFNYHATFSLDLKTSGIERLEKIHGVGPKTSRFFILHTRKNAKVACLDTHILKYLGSLGHQVPRHTPQSKTRYKELENIFLDKADELKMTPAELDIQIWKQYSGNG